MMQAGARRRGGFTLVELLTVAGIAIVLATLIVGAIFNAQESARSASCRNNLNQLHKLIMVYTQTYDQFLPAFWHERWVGELGLAGGDWRSDIGKLRKKVGVQYCGTCKKVCNNDCQSCIYCAVWYMRHQWSLFLSNGGRTFPPRSGNPAAATYWNNIGTTMAKVLGGTYGPFPNPDDINPRMPMVWNNYQPPGNYLGAWGSERPVYRSGAPSLLCPSDTSAYKCDQGPLVSYLGLAKYGWWHRGDTATESRYYEYHQIQEVTNLSRGILLAESEPGTWQFGGCG